MIAPPLDLLRCSWPRPVAQTDGRWVSEPEWDAPAMPHLPQLQRATIDGMPCWLIDWCVQFDGGVRRYNGNTPGEMRGFHVVFSVRVHTSGTLIFWADDGCIIRRDGLILHDDRTTHPMTRGEVTVTTGDVLEIAHWQNYGAWQWAGWLTPSTATLSPYRAAVLQRLRTPNGPPLKLYFGDATPLRAVVAAYSMVLNGYCPASIHIFGEYQWSQATHQLITDLLPFARIVPTTEVLKHMDSLGQPRLVDLAQQHWLVMKAAVSLLYPPYEFCYMDDDVVILDTVDEGLSAFRDHTLVFAPDADYGANYLAIWGGAPANCIGRVNGGLYWLRNARNPRQTASALMRVPPQRVPLWQWEQGFMATYFSGEPFCQLSSQRYFYPYCDGLPGGLVGYDYTNNPCGFASIHFGGLVEKPSDAAIITLAPAILGRNAGLQ